MLRRSILAFVLCSFAVSTAAAAGVGLGWQQCLGDGGVQNRAFACNTNSGSHVLVGSFMLDADLHQVNGVELVVDLCTSTASLPDWWRYINIDACRQTALSIEAQNGPNCPDLFSGQASMNIAAYQLGLQGANSARILSVNAVAAAAVVDLLGGQEYGIAKWTITNVNTVGTGSCAGCLATGCIVFNSANLTTVGGANDTKLTQGMSPSAGYVMWQGGNYGCPFVVPVRTVTWSAVKSLYR